ncbi:MAG: hypothetical protein FRX48_00686 [Lasallia pustulata]|uniref:Heavy metal tolerance protein n=1 Tax=Lasallia pustulata TaxID=136370 RepID=A0A5M8Q3L5_9LECA|nr:MAG: hypothetical protein FRX48_00686 [Lasallia pustulata]
MGSVSDHEQLYEAVKAIHYSAPWVILGYYIIAATVSVCTLQTITAKVKDHKAPRKLIFWVMVLIVATYIGETCVHLSPALSRYPRHVSPDGNIYLLSSVLVWLILSVTLLDSPYPVWYPFYGSWIIALAVEVTLITVTLSYNDDVRGSERVHLTLKALRISLLALVLGLLFGWRKPVVGRDKHDEESTPLLAQTQSATQNKQDSAANAKYGSTVSTTTDGTSSSEDVDSGSEAQTLKEEQENFQHVEKRLKDVGNWWTYARGFSLGIAIDALSNPQGHVPYFEVGLYILYFYLGSYAGIPAVRNWLWLPVEQFAYRRITTAAYNHIMGLSSDFHDRKQSGELYKSIEQGRAVNELLETVLFEVFPTLVDLLVASAYLSYLFGAYMALIVAAMTVFYMWISTYFTAMQSEPRRRQRDLSRKEYQILYDSMGNWRTVSYFNRIPYEQERYSSSVKLHMEAQRSSWMIHYISWGAQSLLLDCGRAVACFLAVYQVASGVQSVGSFVILFSYWNQLIGPLMFFSRTHVQLMKNLIDAEQLLQLFLTKPGVVDRKGAKKLDLAKGNVEYAKVNFTYDGKKQIMKDLSFFAAAGQTIAIIGETGGGKSTILNLLFRFYDVTSGSITIDGQDIRDVTLESLRDSIGVVPQDASLFNDTIMNNIRYSRLDATDDEVFDACKAAAIHNKVMTFTDGYQSKVGERGVRLSGGELQRVAIARALLKNSKIILLDEATSSVDTETEGQIQEALVRLTSGRTTFVVAHRLSTIVNADLIIVIKEGEILEKGTHLELFHARGKYHDLWAKQSFGAPGDAINSDDSMIVNDISSDQNIQGLLEAAKKDLGHHGEVLDPRDSIPAQEDGAAEGVDKEDNPRNALDGLSGEKIWKPDAPDFVPRHLQGITSKGFPASHERNCSAHEDVHGHQAKKGAKHVERSVGAQGAVEQGPCSLPASQPSLVTDQQPEESNLIGQTQKERKRRLHNRRDKSKTEPTTLEGSQTDGTLEIEPGSLGQGGSMSNLSRRVSAPSCPPSAPINAENSARGQPRRRPRHWKIKNRAASRMQSTGGSTNSSTDTTQHEIPPAPSTSPAAGVTSANYSATAAPSTEVRFVSGV